MGSDFNRSFRDKEMKIVSNSDPITNPVDGAKSSREAMGELNVSDFPSHLAVPKSFYGIPKGAFSSSLLSSEARFSIVGGYRALKTEDIEELRSLAREGLIPDHFVNIGYKELEAIENVDGISNGEVMAKNYEAFIHNFESLRKNIAMLILNKYYYHLKRSMGKDFKWNEDIPSEEEEFWKKLSEAKKYIEDNVDDKEMKMYMRILASMNRVMEEVRENGKKRYAPLSSSAQLYFDEIMKELFGEEAEDIKLSNLMEILSLVDKYDLHGENALDELSSKFNSEAYERGGKESEELREDYRKLEEFSERFPSFDLDTDRMRLVKSKIEKLAAIREDVAESSQFALTLMQTAFQNGEDNPIDILDGIVNEGECKPFAEEFKKRLVSAIESAYSNKGLNVKEAFGGIEPEELAKRIIGRIKKEVQSNENVMKKLFEDNDPTASVNPFADNYYHSNVEIVVNSMKDAAFFELLKLKNEDFERFLEKSGTVQKIIGNVDMGLQENRAFEDVNEIMNIHNLIFRIQEGTIGEKEVEMLLNSPIFKNNRYIEEDYKTFAKSVKDAAKKRIDYSQDIYGSKEPEESLQRKVAEQKFLSLFSKVAGKGFKERLLNDLVTEGGVRKLHNCLKKGSIKLSNYHTPSENYSNCFKEFVQEGVRKAEENFNSLLKNGSMVVNSINPFLALAFFERIWAKAKANELERQWGYVLSDVMNNAYYINSALSTKEQKARLAVFSAINGTAEDGHFYQTVIPSGHEKDFEEEVNQESILYSIGLKMDQSEYFSARDLTNEIKLSGKDVEIANRIKYLENKLKELAQKSASAKETAKKVKQEKLKADKIREQLQDLEERAKRGEEVDRLKMIALKDDLKIAQKKVETLIQQLEKEEALSILEEAEKVEKELQRLKEEADIPVILKALGESGAVSYKQLSMKEKRAFLRLFYKRQQELAQLYLDNPKASVHEELEKNQLIMSRLQKEILLDKRVIVDIDYIFGNKESIYEFLAQNDSVKRTIETYIKEGDFSKAKAFVAKESSIPKNLKGEMIAELEFAEVIPSVADQISEGMFTNSPAFKKHLEKIKVYNRDLYDELTKTNGTTVVPKDIDLKDGIVRMDIHHGINSYLYERLDELREIDLELYEKYLQKLEHFEMREDGLRSAAISRKTINAILDRANSGEASYLINEMRRSYNRVKKISLY